MRNRDYDDHETDDGGIEFTQHQQMLRRQDEHLDAMHDAVVRIGGLGDRIGEELEEQAEALDDLGRDIEKAQDGFDAAQEKLDELVKSSGGMRWFCVIVVLIAIIVFLILLILL